MCSLPETMPQDIREQCLVAGIMPLQGQREALEALDAAGRVGETWRRAATVELRRPHTRERRLRTLTEPEAKAALAAFGVRTPRAAIVPPNEVAAAAARIGFPVVLKAVSATLEHKSDVGAVVLDVRTAADAAASALELARWSPSILVEEMIDDGVAEILVGMTVDAHFGQVLVLGAGGTLTELLADTVTLLPPFTLEGIVAAVGTLRGGRLLAGFRGSPPGDLEGLAQTALACARYAQANLETLAELDINPVIVRPQGRGAVAVDALIRVEESSDAAANPRVLGGRTDRRRRSDPRGHAGPTQGERDRSACEPAAQPDLHRVLACAGAAHCDRDRRRIALLFGRLGPQGCRDPRRGV
jgi:acetyl-CoA synthetase